MIGSAGKDFLALLVHHRIDRPHALKIPARRADSTLTENVASPFQAEPRHEENQGQTDARVKFLSRTGAYSLFLTRDEAVLTLRGNQPDTNKAKIAGITLSPRSKVAAPKAGGVLRMRLRRANPAAKVTGLDELPGKSNYFLGNDPGKWRTNVPTYAKVKYEGIYPAIDLV